MSRSLRVAAAVLLVTAGCAAHETTRSGRGSAGMILVSGEQLAARGGGQLLDGLRSRVTALNVVRRSGTCPVVSMRGVKTFVGAKSVGVYVDGTPMMDTCILDQLRVFDIDSVEVYPSGVTNRPGYRANPNGLILVFLAGAVE